MGTEGMLDFPLSADCDFLVEYIEASNASESTKYVGNYQDEFTSKDLFACQSTLSTDSIINFDALDEQDIDIDFLLNENLEIDNEFDSEYVSDKIYSLKSKRKSKHSTLLPYSVHDIDGYGDHGNSLNNEDLARGKPGDRLQLSNEEKQLLARDGHNIPTHLPLTKAEERALKSVRRRIRNKISAKNSRAKKECYVGGLEERIVQCSKENVSLRDRLAELEQDKRGLVRQVGRLRRQLAKFLSESPTSGTSLMLLMLTFMVILCPLLDPRQLLGNAGLLSTERTTNDKQIFPGRSRMLLQESEESIELGEPYMVTIRASPPWQSPPISRAVPPPRPAPTNARKPVNISALVTKDL